MQSQLHRPGPPNQQPSPQQQPVGPQQQQPPPQQQLPQQQQQPQQQPPQQQQQQQQQQPQMQPTKQNRVTTLPKPVGIDPLVILQERENRCVICSVRVNVMLPIFNVASIIRKFGIIHSFF